MTGSWSLEVGESIHSIRCRTLRGGSVVETPAWVLAGPVFRRFGRWLSSCLPALPVLPPRKPRTSSGWRRTSAIATAEKATASQRRTKGKGGARRGFRRRSPCARKTQDCPGNGALKDFDITACVSETASISLHLSRGLPGVDASHMLGAGSPDLRVPDRVPSAATGAQQRSLVRSPPPLLPQAEPNQILPRTLEPASALHCRDGGESSGGLSCHPPRGRQGKFICPRHGTAAHVSWPPQ